MLIQDCSACARYKHVKHTGYTVADSIYQSPHSGEIIQVGTDLSSSTIVDESPAVPPTMPCHAVDLSTVQPPFLWPAGAPEEPGTKVRENAPVLPMVALALRSSIFLRSISSCTYHRLAELRIITGSTTAEAVTYHLANSRQRSCVALDQWSAVVGVIRGSDGDGIRDNDVSLVPSRGHRTAERIEEALSFPGDTLPAASLAFVRLRNSGCLAGFQGADIQRMQWRVCIGKGGSVRRGEGRGEGEELEGLDARDGDDVIVG